MTRDRRGLRRMTRHRGLEKSVTRHQITPPSGRAGQLGRTAQNVQTGPMVYIANTRRADSPNPLRVFSNCEQVSLYTNNVLFATQSPDATYPNLPHPPFTFNLPGLVSGPIRG